jgi:hypothetical protein
VSTPNDEGKNRVEVTKVETTKVDVGAGRTAMNIKTDPKNSGFVPGAVYLALDVADRNTTTAIGLLQDARGEIRQVVDSGIDFAENLTKALFRLGRKATQRLDDATAETLSSTEKLLGGAVKTARETTRAATDVVVTATSGAVGEPKPIAAA